MKTILSISIAFFAFSFLFGQETVSFESKLTDVAFNGNENWTYVKASPQDFFELQNKNHNLNLKIWKVKESMSIQSYLAELLASEGMVALQGPFKTEIDHQKALGVIAMCNEKRKPVKLLFVAVEIEGEINIIRFKCPDECFQNHKKHMYELIEAITIKDKSESLNYLANKSIDT